MARDRADGHVFDAHQFLRETLGLPPEAVGVYVTLRASSWDLPESGVLPAADRTLAILARVTPEEWARISPQVVHLFDTAARPGYWVHRATVEAFSAQKQAFSAKSVQGTAAANARWGKAQHAVGIANGKTVACGPNTGVGLGVDQKKKKTAQLEMGPVAVPPRDDGATERATPRLRQRVKKPPDRTLSETFVAEMAERWKLPPDVIGIVRERFMLEAPHRGYVNYPSAFMNWCRIEAESRHKRGDDVQTAKPVDGQRSRDSRGREVVHWSGNWRTLDDARSFGWKE